MSLLDILLVVALGLVTAALAFILVYLSNVRKRTQELEVKNRDAEKRLGEAKNDADRIIKNALREAKQVAIREGKNFDRTLQDKHSELQRAEKRIQKREESLEQRSKSLDEREQEQKMKLDLIDREEKRAAAALASAENSLQESRKLLENVAAMTVDEARAELRKYVEQDVRKALASEIKMMEDEARKTSEDRARSIIATSIQRICNEFVVDATVSVISLPSDDMKGRIIGREGRNIRAIEQATGVDLIIDDTPEAVIISCFNPMRREIARLAIERLVADGRIHPARIDEIVSKVTSEIEQNANEVGERAAFDCGIEGLRPEMVKLLGKLKYRTTGQQSVLQHSVETSLIAGILASEMELNVRTAKRAGLLHDIGKAIDEDTEGHHSQIGADFARKCGEPNEVVEAIAKHHQENSHGLGPYAVVVQIANQLSAFRPNARKEFLERSIVRMRDVEKTVCGFNGVEQAYVIRSGREVRAMVTPTVMNDEAVTVLARNVARKIKDDLHYPGQIKVTLVRETKVTQVAR